MSLLNKLKEVRLFIFLRMLPDMIKEYWNFSRHTVRCSCSKNKSKQLTEILMLTHSIEKAFSLKDVRSDFGTAKIKELHFLIKRYITLFGYDESLKVPISLMLYYKKFRDHNQVVSAELNVLFNYLENIIAKNNLSLTDFVSAGAIEINRRDLSNLSNVGFEKLSLCRHAIRNFAKSNNIEGLIYDAIDIARHSPSACNRQAYRVHIFSKDKKTELLTIQNGAKLFAKDAEKAILITGDMNRYYTMEQHLMFVDASLFAMSLMYALTAKGIANIPLTLCVKSNVISRIKEKFEIPDNEMPVIMIAVGNYPEKAKIAMSERIPVSCFTTIH